MPEITLKKKLIICHPLKLIFIKTKKVAGTSFEVALSKYCSDQCTVTPISQQDERVRQSLGFTGPQNYLKEVSDTGRLIVKNHSNTAQIRTWLGDKLFFSYRKITIHRDPLDFLISQYYYRMQGVSLNQKIPFYDWVQENQQNVLENYEIAPLKGENRCDVVFNYESLYSDISNCGFLPQGFAELLNSLRLKGDFRSKESLDVNQFYRQHGVDPKPIIHLIESLGNSGSVRNFHS